MWRFKLEVEFFREAKNGKNMTIHRFYLVQTIASFIFSKYNNTKKVNIFLAPTSRLIQSAVMTNTNQKHP